MEKKKQKRLVSKRILLFVFIGTTVTGIGLHLSRHGGNFALSHNLMVAHMILSALFFIAVMVHVKRHSRSLR